MTPEEQKTGRDRVRLELIHPLEQDYRCKRPRGVSVEDHAKELDLIASRLCHLSVPDLVILRETVVENLGRDGRWPAPSVVIGLANVLCKRPDFDTERVVNLVRWAKGKAEIPDDVLPAVYRWLRGHSRPPSVSTDLPSIQRQAREDDEWEQRMADVQRRTALSTEENRRMAYLAHSRKRVREILGAEGLAA